MVGGRLYASARDAPLGIVCIAALLAMIGLGSVAGGIYLLLSNGTLTAWAAASAIIAGPAILYLAYSLLRLAYWTWRALLLLLFLLLVSSLIRLFVTPGVAIAPLLEIAVEVGTAAYLLRPTLRGRFQQSGIS